MDVLDRAFPLESSDFEIGDAYERMGIYGVFLIEKVRAGDQPSDRLKHAIAARFHMSPSDVEPLFEAYACMPYLEG